MHTRSVCATITHAVALHTEVGGHCAEIHHVVLTRASTIPSFGVVAVLVVDGFKEDELGVVLVVVAEPLLGAARRGFVGGVELVLATVDDDLGILECRVGTLFGRVFDSTFVGDDA